MRTENTNHTYMNVQEGNLSDNIRQVSHYENSDVTQNHEKRDEEGTEVTKVYEEVQGNEHKETVYEAFQGNGPEQVTEYEEIKLDPINM